MLHMIRHRINKLERIAFFYVLFDVVFLIRTYKYNVYLRNKYLMDIDMYHHYDKLVLCLRRIVDFLNKFHRLI